MLTEFPGRWPLKEPLSVYLGGSSGPSCADEGKPDVLFDELSSALPLQTQHSSVHSWPMLLFGPGHLRIITITDDAIWVMPSTDHQETTIADDSI